MHTAIWTHSFTLTCTHTPTRTRTLLMSLLFIILHLLPLVLCLDQQLQAKPNQQQHQQRQQQQQQQPLNVRVRGCTAQAAPTAHTAQEQSSQLAVTCGRLILSALWLIHTCMLPLCLPLWLPPCGRGLHRQRSKQCACKHTQWVRLLLTMALVLLHHPAMVCRRSRRKQQHTLVLLLLLLLLLRVWVRLWLLQALDSSRCRVVGVLAQAQAQVCRQRTQSLLLLLPRKHEQNRQLKQKLARRAI